MRVLGTRGRVGGATSEVRRHVPALTSWLGRTFFTDKDSPAGRNVTFQCAGIQITNPVSVRRPHWPPAGSSGGCAADPRDRDRPTGPPARDPRGPGRAIPRAP